MAGFGTLSVIYDSGRIVDSPFCGLVVRAGCLSVYLGTDGPTTAEVERLRAAALQIAVAVVDVFPTLRYDRCLTSTWLC